ncbi:Dyp-type peroxidase family [Chryseobacterium defluvii]|uniref:Dyp-type peroxidase family n=1 Tax=Chryseobacterium defluvii TaxID=160396 RepID=A0A840K577_9FLAO|nr:pyruvate formate lyase family protein [Chryseobacterium defluvii]MBB4804741.1 Dyp-type peroxidase family [Chryseobacterium defluvii]
MSIHSGLKNSEPWFNSIQGNILKPHGRNYHATIILSFDPSEIEKLKHWISNLNITTFKEQLEGTRVFHTLSISKQISDTSDVFTSFYLSASGYGKLGFTEDDIPNDPAFMQGMKVSGKKLNDSSANDWDPAYQHTVDAVLMLAHDDKEILIGKRNKITEEIQSFVNILGSEFGSTVRDEDGFSREPFGFRDGISNPIFLEEDIQKFSSDPDKKFDMRATKEVVLTQDPNDRGSFGSYVVFRKLEQNVKAFHEAERKISESLGMSDPEKIGALIIGRLRNGNPIIDPDSSVADRDKIKSNNWDFSADSSGSKCPFHAHIRKANDRGESLRTGVGFGDERYKRIVRRGFTYVADEDRNFVNLQFAGKSVDYPENGTGTIFVAFQSSIADQFEKLMVTNINNVDYFKPHTGNDALLGSRNGAEADYKFSHDTKSVNVQLDSFITLKGGEYFFAPSVPFLKSLANSNNEASHRLGKPSSDRTASLRKKLVERSFSNRKNEWFTKEMLPNILSAKPQLARESVIVRQAFASEEMLKAMANSANSVHTHTYEILEEELIVGTMPMGSVGLGKTFPGYLTDDEARAASLSNRDEGSVFAHTVPNFKRILQRGLNHVIEFSEEKIASQSITNEQNDFYKAVVISCKAVIDYANSFADLAVEESQKTSNEKRKNELLQIASVCRKVPAYPAETLQEALQSVWFIHLAETAFCIFNSLGRLDQVLNEYLENDLQKGTITNDHALELVECFLIKCAQRLNLNPTTLKDQDFLTFGTGIGTRAIYLDQIASCNNFIQNIILAGVKPDGTDGTNEATLLFLKAHGNIGLATPTMNVRVGKNSPEKLLNAIDSTFRNAGNGHPILYNEDNVIAGLKDAGLPEAEARDFAVAGCWEPMLHGKNSFIFGMVNMLQVPECALNEGTFFSSDPQFLVGQKQSWKSPAPNDYRSFDDLMAEVKKHMRFFADKIALGTCSFFQFPSAVTPTPFMSVLLDGCLERGTDQSMGGADYNIISNLAFAVPNTANALANIKKYIFDEKTKKWDLKELADALRANWGMSVVRNEYEQQEIDDESLKDKYYQMRRTFLESDIKFGNDNEYVDKIAAELMDYWYWACKESEALARKAFLANAGDAEADKLRMMANYPADSFKATMRNDLSIHFTSGAGTFGQYSSMGKGVNASGDGRAANDALVPNCSPMAGTAINGLTGIFKTLEKLQLERFGGAVVTDIRVDGINQPVSYFRNLIEEWTKHGGNMLTVSVLSTNDVLEMIRLTDRIKNDPGNAEELRKYADRFCRVGGWNSGFICLPRPQQRDHLLRASF